MSFSLIVFDLDGTLVDSRKDLADAANELLALSGAAPLADEAIAGMIGEGAPALVSRAFGAAGIAAPPDALARFLDIYDARLLARTQPYPGTAEALAALSSRAALAVLTNKPLGATRRILAGLDFAKHFAPRRVLGGDGPLPRKPSPDGLQWLMDDAGVASSDTLMVGDSVIDWRTAHNAGAHACLVRYGFGFAGLPPGCLTAGDHVIDAPAALLDL
ncbi:MAG: HAD-IA family hydrolase [Acidobacteria bacterium]|nr:HAD-IA family hydrolase [Acidobacteriota bacterium]